MNTEKVSRNTHTETDNSTYIDMYQEISTSVYRHCFHEKCIECIQNNKCPYCRQETYAIIVKSIKPIKPSKKLKK